MRFSASMLAAGIAVLLSATQAKADPQVEIVRAQRMQPGWVRVYLQATDAPANAGYQASLVCASPTSGDSVSTAQTTGSVLGIDIKVNAGWLADNSLPRPCRISGLTVSMQVNGIVYADATETVDIPMDLPLSLMTPDNTPVAATQAAVPLAPTQTYAAWPPLFVVIQSATGSRGFAEVEELTDRGTVGLRGLAVFSQSGSTWSLASEFGGGAEMMPGWGLDIGGPDVGGLGIWRAPQLPVETTNPGHDVFPYTVPQPPPAIESDNPPSTANDVFPFAPLYTEAQYEQYVLNNRGVPRCQTTTGCMDVTYDTSNASQHTLKAANNATLALVTPAAIVLRQQTLRSQAFAAGGGSLPGPRPIEMTAPVTMPPVHAIPALPSTTAAVIAKLDPEVTQRLLAAASQLSDQRTGNFTALQQMPLSMPSSRAPMKSNAVTRDWAGFPESPQEAQIAGLPRGLGGGGVISQSPTASCVINAAQNGVTKTPSGCNGMDVPGFACPTTSSPIPIEQITATTDQAAFLSGTIPPYYAGRDNKFGTCLSHSYTQYVEALYDRYTDDLAIKRVIYVDGDPIVVPEPRVALSVTGGIVQIDTWDGTHLGDPPNDPSYPSGSPTQPLYPEAYWPAREANWSRWVAAAGQQAPTANLDCDLANFFASGGFCKGQGHPPQGVYRAHTIMAQTLFAKFIPLDDTPWSLADSYIDIATGVSIPLADLDAAIQAVIAQIQLGLPVNLTFLHFQGIATPDGSGGSVTFSSGPTWYVPPELGACSVAALDTIFAPWGGHAVNIVGYWISGTAAAPNLFNSYFIIENNWGKTAGYHSFYFMNFAAFKYLATSLTTFRLNRQCWSVACASTPPLPVVPRNLVQQLLYPPDPATPAGQSYSAILNDVRAQMSGVPVNNARSPAPARQSPMVK
jgi:hypothetical protein